MQKVINRKKLIALVSEECAYFQHEVDDVLLGLETVLHRELLDGKEIKISDLFTLVHRKSAPTKRYNNLAGKVVDIKPSASIKIKCTAAFKKELLDASLQSGEL